MASITKYRHAGVPSAPQSSRCSAMPTIGKRVYEVRPFDPVDDDDADAILPDVEFKGQVVQVKELADRLVHWLNHPERDDVERCPGQVRMSLDGYARIVLTKAGKAQGWLPVDHRHADTSAGGAR